MAILPTIAAALLLAPIAPSVAARQFRAVPLDVHAFKVLGQEYDPENPHKPEATYYQTIEDPKQSFIHGEYLPPKPTVTLFCDVPDELHHGVRRMTWRWRAQVLPLKGNEGAAGLRDSAGAGCATWKPGRRCDSLQVLLG